MSSSVRLAIDAELCGPVSVGTIKIIHLVRVHTGLSLSEAKDLVDRCVFAGETVDIPMPSHESALQLADALKSLPQRPAVHATAQQE